jgi:transitional endoplasmic reticulum ATPase
MSALKNVQIKTSYKIKHFIEQTSFCTIYTGIDLNSSKLVNLNIYKASKIARDDLGEDGNLRELSFLKLGVEGFPKLLSFGEFTNDLEKYRYIATEFISGESVMDRMKRIGSLGEFDAIRVGLKLAEIAHNLHSRDQVVLLNGLSLDNIIFNMSGESETINLRNLINMRYFDEAFKYKYLDGLGLSHLAPEVFNDVFTPKTDLYNIAALTYQMVCGVLPYHDAESQDLKAPKDLISYLETRNQPLNFSEVFEPHLKKVLQKALHQDADQRFNTLVEFSTFLNREKLLGVSKATTPKKTYVKRGDGFDDIAGMQFLKNQLRSEVLDVLKRPEHFKKYGVTIPNGMLLYGPPGCGKSFIAEKFCEEAGFNFFMIKPSDLSSIYVSGGEEKIGQLFSEAAANAPTVICFDEVDAMMPKRSDDTNQSISARVNEFLAQINKCADRGLFVIATTNKPNLIDEAMLRTGRLEMKIYVSPPDDTARAELFKLYLKNRHCEVGIDFKALANLTPNIVASDVEFIVNKAAHKAAIQDVRISMSILTDVVENFSPSVNKSIIDSYETEHQLFSNSEIKTSQKPTIGFKRN